MWNGLVPLFDVLAVTCSLKLVIGQTTKATPSDSGLSMMEVYGGHNTLSLRGNVAS